MRARSIGGGESVAVTPLHATDAAAKKNKEPIAARTLALSPAPDPVRLTRRPCHGTRRFTTCTDRAAAARSTVEALTFRAVTRTLLFDHTWQSSTKAMLLVSSEASAKCTHPVSLSITHISDGAFALSESFVILFVTPIRGGVTDEWGEGSQYIRLA
ncbi:MAG: hypothetical protein ACK530_19725 [Alphaproteobacteria bacterium]|jgi:hypothetical protein